MNQRKSVNRDGNMGREIKNAHLRQAVRASVGAMLAGRAASRGGVFDSLESRIMMSASDVVINEIMYNSATAETADEYVELYNKGTTPVNLTGWTLKKGVDYTFGNQTLNAGAYLVVAADLTRFAQKYPAVSNVVGPWTGHLSNSADSIELDNNLGEQIDEVDYAQDGDWAARRPGGLDAKAVSAVTRNGTVATFTVPAHGYANGTKVAVFGANQGEYDGIFTVANSTTNTFDVTVSGTPISPGTGQIYVRAADNKHFGYDWFSPAAGGGKSLELINPNMPNNQGQNWGASIPDNGTPGAANSIASSNIAPIIQDLSQFPIIPKSTDQVTISARISDELSTGLSVQVFYRNDGDASFNSLTMFDDGLHGDGSAHDGVYGANLPAQPNGTVVEFYVKATDSSNNSRTLPGPTDVTGVQGANALYQVDDTPYSGTQPLFKIIMTAADAAELAAIGKTYPDDLSNAAFNGTFISEDGAGTDIRYQIAYRNRGGGSRIASVANYRIDFTNFQPWHNEVKLNLNGTWSTSDIAGSALASAAGIPAQTVTPVQVWVNNKDLATAGNTDGMYGSYAYVEAEDKYLVQNHFPTDDQGNYYRGVDGGHNANLSYIDNNPASYYTKYPKETNQEANDYTDLINLTKALSAPSTGTNAAAYKAGVLANLNVTEALRYFAFNILIGNFETSLGTGYGDDFALYRGINDTHFQIVAHDLDSILTLGDPTASPAPPAVNQSIFRATAVATIKSLMQFPDFAQIYFQQLKDLADNVFTPAEIGRVLHHQLDGFVPSANIDAAVNQATARAVAVLAQIPSTLAVTTTPAVSGGYPKVTNSAQLAAMTLGGTANALITTSILVNGKPATYTEYKGAWTITNASNTLGLQGGLNRVIVQEMDANNKEVGRTYVDVWYSSPVGTNVSGAITTNTTWSAASGPYHVTANVTVNAGASLTIQPGTTVYFASGTRLTVNGLLNAVGTDMQRITFTRDPAGTTTWNGIYFSNTAQANKLAYADIEYAGVGGPDTQIASSTVDVDHVMWNHVGSGQRIVDITGNPNFSITNCITGNLTGEEPMHYLGPHVFPAGSRAIVSGNVYGVTTGHNDIFDFTGGSRPGPIVQFLNNIFTGTGTGGVPADDQLDLDGTDAHVEGNVFMNVIHSLTADTNSSISGGSYDYGSGAVSSNIVSTRNFYYNVDFGVLSKEGNFIYSTNETFVNVGTAVFHFYEVGNANTGPGLGGVANGDIFYNVPTGTNTAPLELFDQPTGSFVTRNTISSSSTVIPGTGNLSGDPQLIDPQGPGPANSNTDQAVIGMAIAMDPWFASTLAPFVPNGGSNPDLGLKPTSPAKGTGPNGADMGAAVPAGATIVGWPVGTSPFNTATLTVGGPAIIGYQWKLDNGAYSATVNVTNPLTANAVIPPIVLSGLSNGPHTVSVIGINDAGVLQTQATVSKTWTVNTALAGRVRINEVLADNVSALANGSTHPDAIELYNDGKGTIDLSDYSISDDPAVPRKFVFPAGTTLAQGAYLTLFADSPSAAPGIHLGFSLSASGDGVYLYNNLASGGGLVDSVTFGTQLTDKSIGRIGDGTTWGLTTPTLGSANVALITGDPHSLKINEWLADGLPPFSADFVELYNPDPLPVEIGGMSITDKTTGWPDQNIFTSLSFIDGAGYLKLTADKNTSAGADHLNFQLNHDRGEIGLYDSSLKLVDSVFYGAQSSGVSEGLSPDGSSIYAFFNQPSPGLSNPAVVSQDITVNLSKVDDVWKYDQTDQFNNQSWTLAGFSDSSWQQGPGVIYHEDAALPWTKNTELSDASHPYSSSRIAYYFRRTFNVPDPSAISVLHLNVLIDDGAVLYLNGQEIKRIGMPTGSIVYSTLANRAVGDAVVEGEFLIPSSFLVAGQNTLAVEVHQTSTTSTDITFGMTLDATEHVDAVPPPPLRVTELMYNPPGNSSVPGDEYEYIELQNTGSSPLNITGYKFAAGVQFTFPNMILAPGEKTLVVKDLAAFTARYGSSLPIAGQYIGSLDNGGEVIRLQTPDNRVIQDFSYSDTWFPSTDGKGDSLVINNPYADPSTWSTPGAWHASTATLGTPGIDETVFPPQDAVVVNEVLANSSGPNDWIELKNTTAAPIDISGWYLSDSASNLMKYQIPAGTVIPASGFITFTQQQTFGSIYQGTNAFALSEAGDDVYVSSSSAPGVLGAYRTAAHFGASDPGVTMGRYTTSTGRVDFVALATPTHSAENSLPKVGPVVINEINYHPLATKDEWIEIKNITSSTVPLYDPAHPLDTWAISDGVDFTFPTGLSLAPGEIMIIVPDSISPADFRTKYGISASVQVVGGYTGALNNAGEHVALSKPGAPQADLSVPQILVDDVDYGTATPWPAAPDGTGPALARFVETSYGNDVANWRASTATGGTPSGVNDSSPVTATGKFLELSANQLTFQFSKNVQASLTTADLQLTNLTTGQPVATASISLSYNATSNIATFTFPGLANGRLTSGRYRAVLLASGIDASGAALDGNGDGVAGDNYTFDFVHLPGDLNSDGKVDFTDFQKFEVDYGKTGATWADGDFNYDGTVNDPDLKILMSALNTVLPAAPLPSDPAPVSSPQPTPVPIISKPVSITPTPAKPPAVTAKSVAVTAPAKPTTAAPAPAHAILLAKPAPIPKPAPVATPFSATRISRKKDAANVWA